MKDRLPTIKRSAFLPLSAVALIIVLGTPSVLCISAAADEQQTATSRKEPGAPQPAKAAAKSPSNGKEGARTQEQSSAAQAGKSAQAQASPGNQPDKTRKALSDLVELGVALMDAGQYELASRALSCAMELGEDSPEARYYLAYCQSELGDQEEAAQWYAKAIEAASGAPKDYSALIAKLYNNYGVTLVKLGKFKEALASYQKAVKSNPEYAPAYFNLGLLYETHLNKPAEAIEAYRRHVTLGGEKGITARNAILRLQEKAGEKDKKEPAPPAVPASP